jgi:hypothetical protein
MMNWEGVGSGFGLIKALNTQLPGGTEKNHKTISLI